MAKKRSFQLGQYGGRVYSPLEGLMDPADAIEAAMLNPKTATHMARLQRSDEFRYVLDQLQEFMAKQGAYYLRPLDGGYESVVFDTNNGMVVKIGPEDYAFDRPRSYTPPKGVEGVLPYSRQIIETPNMDWNVILQNKVDTKDAGWRDVGYLTDLVTAQGYRAIDAHPGNVGFASKEPYRPVLFDGVVLPRPTKKTAGRGVVDEAVGAPLVLPGDWRPPSTRPWLLAALTAGAASAPQLLGLDRVQASEPIRPDEMPNPLVQFGKYSDPRSTAEKLTGGDWSFDISPYEQKQWEADQSLGYLGEDHRQYIQNAVSMLDEPLIPGEYIQQLRIAAPEQIGQVFPGYEGGDMTPRQFLSGAKYLEASAAHRAWLENPNDPEAMQRFTAAAAAIQTPTEQGEGTELNPFSDPYAANAFAQLTGQASKPMLGDVGPMLINGLRSGTTNRVFEDDPSITDSEFAQVQKQIGDDANRYLSEGGQANLKRERAADFFGALRNEQQYNPNMNVGSAAMALLSGPNSMPGGQGPKHRFDTMMDPSSHRGRMQFANARLAAANQVLSPGEGQPVVMRGDAVNRLDPYSMQGFSGITGNSSWGYGRAYNQFSPLFGDIGTRSQLKQTFDDERPLKFLAEAYNRSMRETPIRPDNQSPQSFIGTRAMALRRQGDGMLDYYSSLGPRMADAWNQSGVPEIVGRVTGQDITAPRSHFPQIIDSAIKMGPAIAKSPMQLGIIGAGVGGPALLQGGGRASLAGAMAGAASEALVEEPVENMMLGETTLGELFSPANNNSWLRPYEPGTNGRTRQQYDQMLDPQNKQLWDQAVKETEERDFQQVNDEYSNWLQRNKARLQRTYPASYRQ